MLNKFFKGVRENYKAGIMVFLFVLTLFTCGFVFIPQRQAPLVAAAGSFYSGTILTGAELKYTTKSSDATPLIIRLEGPFKNVSAIAEGFYNEKNGRSEIRMVKLVNEFGREYTAKGIISDMDGLSGIPVSRIEPGRKVEIILLESIKLDLSK